MISPSFIISIQMLINLAARNSGMGKIHQLTDREKALLNAIGRHPDISMKELLTYTDYKWVSTLARKLNQLKEQGILSGPLYDFNHGKLCRNPLHKLVSIVETQQSYEILYSYLKLIEPLIWIFPVLSSQKKVLQVGFFSSDDAEMEALLQLLKDNGVISGYTVRVSHHKRIVENPNLFGDPNPSLDGLLDPCELPDTSLGHHDTVWNECDIAILPYLLRGAKLIDILRKEKKLQKNWTYEQMRYSRRKISQNGLVQKKYIFFPFPCEACAHFHLFLKTDDTTLTQRIIHNFARGERIYKEYLLYDDWGMLVCMSYPPFLTGLLYRLDQIDKITDKELYQVRSNSGKYWFSRPLELKYYDFDEQTLEYPYHVYREQMKEKLESE
jgi:hypothetical protein